MIASAVDWNALGEVVVASFVAGLGVTLTFSLTLLGATRAVDLRRDGHAGASSVYVVVMLVGLAGTVGAIVLGILAMIST